MKALCALVVSLVVSGVSPAGQAPRVRPLDRMASLSYDRGLRQSETFRALVAELEASNLIVHIVTTTGMPGGVAGTTRFGGRHGGSRYVRIDLAASLSAKGRVSILAHELQHACEIARSNADSLGAVDALYRAIGTKAPLGPSGFETADAQAAGRTVWGELDARRRRARSVER